MRKAVAALGVLVAVVVAGWWMHQRLPEHVAARVDGVDFPMAAVDLFVSMAQNQNPELTRKVVLDGLIENHLFATRLESDHGHQDGGSGIVAYSDTARIENDLFRVIRRAYAQRIEAALAAEGVSKPSDLFEGPLLLDRDQLAPMLALQPGLYASMSEDQLAAAQQLVLVRYRQADGSVHDMTLADLYERQNIQLKVQLHDLNMEFLRQAAAQFASTQYVLSWFDTHSGLDAASIEAVKRFSLEKMQKDEALHALGLMQDIHDDNPELKALADKVSAEEVAAYYDAHRDQFQRVERVRARHIQLGSQEQADSVFRELQTGLPFDQAIKQYSQAQDKDAPIPGDLGWIERADRHTHWLRSIAFVQPLEKFSAPFRSPGRAADQVVWEIIFLDEKVMGYQPADSEGVRYEASKAIAREKLQQRLVDTRARLWREADIRYQQAWLENEG